MLLVPKPKLFIEYILNSIETIWYWTSTVIRICIVSCYLLVFSLYVHVVSVVSCCTLCVMRIGVVSCCTLCVMRVCVVSCCTLCVMRVGVVSCCTLCVMRVGVVSCCVFPQELWSIGWSWSGQHHLCSAWPGQSTQSYHHNSRVCTSINTDK